MTALLDRSLAANHMTLSLRADSPYDAAMKRVAKIMRRSKNQNRRQSNGTRPLPMGGTGAADPAGSAGLAGPAGLAGSAGLAGLAGLVGPVGSAGSAGSEGSVGPAGLAGPGGSEVSEGSVGPRRVFSSSRFWIVALQSLMMSFRCLIESSRSLMV